MKYFIGLTILSVCISGLTDNPFIGGLVFGVFTMVYYIFYKE